VRAYTSAGAGEWRGLNAKTLSIKKNPPEDAVISMEYNVILLTCSAVGATSYQWTDLSTGNIVSNSSIYYISIDDRNGYQCIALNEDGSKTAIVKGEMFQLSH
jgi:hypothetical protein